MSRANRDILPSGDWTIPPEVQEAANRNRQAARAAREPEALAVRAARIEADTRQIVEKDPTVPIEEARERARAALEHGDLHADFPIVIVEGGTERVVTVREIWGACERYHEVLTLDPVEPEYRGRKTVGIVYANSDGSIVLHSQAHGGRTYHLHGRPLLIVKKGELEIGVEKAVALIADRRFFDFGGRVATINKGKPATLTGVALNHEIEREIEVKAYRKAKKRPTGDADSDADGLVLERVNLPREFSDRITSNARLVSKLPALLGVRRDPLIWPDGRYFAERGYDPVSQLWFELDNQTFKMPDAPSDADVRESFDVLWNPVTGYKFKHERDRSALLSAQLTAICRLALPLAPAFLVVAPMRGSGKTRLALSAATLAGEYSLIDVAGNPDEADKRIDTLLMGAVTAVVLDNLLTGDEMSRASVASMLTAEHKTIRRYGSNTEGCRVSTRRFVIGNANNPRLTGDGVRRVVPIHILPTSAAPHLDRFDFDPVEVTQANRQAMVHAGLVLLRAGIGTSAGATLGSFETWAQFVGGALERCRSAGVDGLASFDSVLTATTGEDPTAAALNSLIDQLPEMTATGIDLASIARKVTDGFGYRSTDTQSAELAAALDALGSSENLQAWSGAGKFNTQKAGRLFSRLDGRLFVRGGEEWILRYAGGRGAMVCAAPATA